MSLGVFLLAFLASARITRFVNADVLGQPARDWVTSRFGPGSGPETLVECPWCASIWITAFVVPLAYLLGDSPWFIVPAVGLAISYLYGLLAPRVDPGYDEPASTNTEN